MTTHCEQKRGSEPTTETIAALQILVANCFKHPDETTARAIDSGTLGSKMQSRADTLGLDMDPQPTTSRPREAYLRTFEAYESEFAPPAESAYKPWWDGTEQGLLSGPPAHDMQKRYESLGVDLPAAYPPDHIAVLLEYGSLLLESGEMDAYLAFHEQHYDWIPAFCERIDQTAGVSFYIWAASTLETVLDRSKTLARRQTDE